MKSFKKVKKKKADKKSKNVLPGAPPPKNFKKSKSTMID